MRMSSGKLCMHVFHHQCRYVAKSFGVGDITINKDRCFGFKPELDDRIFTWMNEDGEMFITKMSKNRQEK